MRQKLVLALARKQPTPRRSNKNAYPLPAIANDRLDLRDQDGLLCYGIKGE
jgi:hypothetical protein